MKMSINSMPSENTSSENQRISFADAPRKSSNTESSGYRRRVSFDNVNRSQITHHSFTLNQSSHNYKRTARSRTFMVAYDLDEGAADAIKFTLEKLVDEGDEIVVVGSSYVNKPISHPRRDAEQIMDWIAALNTEGVLISIIIELSFNRPDDALDQMIKMYQPSAVIVGSKNQQKHKNHCAGTGVFKYRLQITNVPIVIVNCEGRRSSTGDIIEVDSSSQLSETVGLTRNRRRKRSLCFFF